MLVKLTEKLASKDPKHNVIKKEQPHCFILFVSETKIVPTITFLNFRTDRSELNVRTVKCEQTVKSEQTV